MQIYLYWYQVIVTMEVKMIIDNNKKDLGFNETEAQSILSRLDKDKLPPVKQKKYKSKRQLIEYMYDRICELIGDGYTIATIAELLSNNTGSGDEMSFEIEELTLKNYLYKIRTERKKALQKQQREEREKQKKKKQKPKEEETDKQPKGEETDEQSTTK